MEWTQESDLVPRDVITSIRGGGWTKVNRKVAFDCIRGYASNKPAKEFCRRYGLGDNRSWAFARYSEEIAGVLASEWCKRLQYFFDLYVGQGSGKYVFTRDDHAGYQACPTFHRVTALLHADDPAMQQVEKLSKLVPWFPRW